MKSGYIKENGQTLLPITHEFLVLDNNGISISNKYALKTEITKSYNDLTDKPTIPTKTSELVNDSNFTDKTYVDKTIASAVSGTTVDLSSYATKEELNTKADKVHTHTEYLTEIPLEYVTETMLSTKGYLTSHQDISLKADKSYVDTNLSKKVDIEGHIATENNYTTVEKNKLAGIETNANNYVHPLNHEATIITEDTSHRFVTDIEKNTWNSKSDFSGSYNDLTEKPTIHTKTSQLVNDSNFTDKTYVDSAILEAITNNKVDLSNYVIKEELNTKADKTEIPTKVSQLDNDSNYVIDNGISLKYDFENAKPGYAQGVITLSVDDNTLLGTYEIKYSDSTGILDSYDVIATFNITSVNESYCVHFIPNTFLPQEASKIVAVKNNSIIATYNIPKNKILTETPIAKIGLLSDIHIKGGDETLDKSSSVKKFKNALDYFLSKSIDRINVCGDITDDGYLADIEKFNEIEALYPSISIYTVRGNHDCINDLNDYYKWNRYTGYRTLYYSRDYEGDVYIYLGLRKDSSSNPFANVSLLWLHDILEANKKKRVFLFEHYFYENTGNIGLLYPYGEGLEEKNANAEKFIKLIKEYRNVVLFTGHSHLDFTLQRLHENANICERTENLCHRVHISSCSKPRTVYSSTPDIPENVYNDYEGSYGYIMETYEHRIVLKGIDFTTNKMLPHISYILNTLPVLVEGIDTPTALASEGLVTNFTTFSQGKIDSSGNFVESSSSYCSDFITYDSRSAPAFKLPKGLTNFKVAYYDSNKQFIRTEYSSAPCYIDQDIPTYDDTVIIIDPSGSTKYIRISFYDELDKKDLIECNCTVASSTT